MTSPWCVLGNKITALGRADLSKHTHMPRSGLLCVVLFPDGTTQNFTVIKHDAGHLLFDLACEHLNIVEKQYFSLQISEDTSSSPRWLDPNKPFKKQLKGSAPFFLIFRVRFFISDPNSLQHEQTRHFYFLQIKKDICEGRLKCPLSSAVVLASYSVQSELGDYVPETPAGYLSQTHFLPDQDQEFLLKVESLHPQHKGLSQSEAELCYLNTARTLDLYGVELHHAQDVNNPALWVGITSGGVALFCHLICSSFFPWINIIKISFKRKRFFVHLRRKHGELGHHVVSLSMPSSRACKNLWKSCVDHHTFYNRKPSHSASKLSSIPLYRKLIGEIMLNPAVRSNSVEQLETKSLPSRSPPNTPNWRSPRLRHDFRKPRPSSVDNLTNEMSYVTESEDVFYTYRKPQEEGRTSGSWSHSDDIITEEDDLHIRDKSVTADGDLLLVRISPDQDGKFGFNVKGGVDQKMPLAISHVNPASPASHCVPPLMEGDQVLLINGRDISEHTHQQVVMFIKASRESHSKELALLVRRKGVSLRVEPTLQLGEGLALPGEISPLSAQPSGETLEESMTRLERGLVTGTLLLHFEKLYRKKEGMSMFCAKQSENMDKNRYKDVLPYDITRVVLQEEGDDYINASHVKTEPTGCALQYIAAQGPLPHTCTHFWRSVWEQNVSVIVMLTTLTERGRTKCHQYWPHPPEVRDYGYLQVCCHSEECNLAYVTRELTLTNTQSGQQRSITHLQYVAWPDHGVPEDSSDFLDFVQSMRSMREESVPLMVHCSAGIGRTGVLITMETAMTLMEKEKPVYPLEIITLMREQRAMLVQTSCQFTFVCEAILRVYRERMKKSSTPNS
ncbi:tyrosine-protein phosphatase non-receptor type 3-like [Sinocyclocheilus rhinocerous]|uniref:protein-tyrosine-phosphatase n=1 Tax=Sinocyclocheilus rhinocerous TaxID=307959 RepID=A0A673M7G7_9TELE|nr:PREDICTED: tyrosine-protein phosphatase non-receptor type 3-like [Sinocyclocheilus rhinocerous]